jgi:RNA-directed DNA polymerase
LTSDARSRALAVPSFSGPLHQPGAGIPAGTDEMFVVLHLLSHGASWRRFTFLGYAFRSRGARSKHGGSFTGFLPAISPEALKAKSARLRELRIHRRSDLSLDDLARWLNPIIAGWINYYGRFYRTALDPLLQRVNTYLRRWAGRKYKRLRTHQSFSKWWTGLLTRAPGLFAHWSTVRSYY